MMYRFARVVVINAFVFFGALAVLELTLETVAWRFPAYDVLAVDPDPTRGWKLAPNLKYTWTGFWWYASDYSVKISHNSHGFRDKERPVNKPANTLRVAVLGDSFVEARSVTLEKTAAGLLEHELNQRARGSKWEVLNFGTQAYGLGQSYLTWREKAYRFEPDFVFLYVSSHNMLRTVDQFHEGLFTEKTLRLRPTFAYDEQPGDLVYRRAEDYETFARLHSQLLKSTFDENRSAKRTLVLPFLFDKVVRKISEKLDKKRHSRTERSLAEILALNLKLIDRLRIDVANAGGELVIVDINGYWGLPESLMNTSKALKELCRGGRCGYIPSYRPLVEARDAGVNLRWKRDGHFNETANRIVADTLIRWFDENVPASATSG